MANDPNYNPLGQERYDELARLQTKARGLPGPDGDAPTPTGAVVLLSDTFSVNTPIPNTNVELTRYTFSSGELNPATDIIAMQIWPTSDAPDAGGVWENVNVFWNTTGLFSLPANDVSGFCWYSNMAQFSNNSNADVLLIDPGPTTGMGVRPFGPQYNSIALTANWMSNGGSLIFNGRNITGSLSPIIRAIIKVWKITPTGASV